MRIAAPLVAAFAAAFLISCNKEPDVFMPPVQRQPFLSDQAPKQAKRLVRMGEEEADAYIMSDLPKGEKGPWRWTGKRPTVRIYVTNTSGFKFFSEFSIADATFKDTGPVTLQFFVNGKLVETRKFEKPGAYTLEKELADDLLKPNADNDLAIEIDKVWVAPDDGAKLGFLLTSLGLTR